MLSLEQIKNYYPTNLKGFERFMLREYLQYKILEIVFDSKYTTQLAFIGGTALRILYGSERFSEDLDFDNFNLTENDFAAISTIIKNKLKLNGYDVEIRNVSKGAFHCYLRFPKLLPDYGLSGRGEEKIMIRLDSEAQHFNFQPEAVLINKFDVFTKIMATPADILLAQKLYAIINRKKNKGRDFFDVVFLLGRNIIPNYKYLNQKLAISNRAELDAILMEKLKNIDMAEMVDDVRPFLFNIKDERKILLFKQYIEQSKY